MPVVQKKAWAGTSIPMHLKSTLTLPAAGLLLEQHWSVHAVVPDQPSLPSSLNVFPIKPLKTGLGGESSELWPHSSSSCFLAWPYELVVFRYPAVLARCPHRVPWSPSQYQTMAGSHTNWRADWDPCDDRSARTGFHEPTLVPGVSACEPCNNSIRSTLALK